MSKCPNVQNFKGVKNEIANKLSFINTNHIILINLEKKS